MLEISKSDILPRTQHDHDRSQDIDVSSLKVWHERIPRQESAQTTLAGLQALAVCSVLLRPLLHVVRTRPRSNQTQLGHPNSSTYRAKVSVTPEYGANLTVVYMYSLSTDTK